ncbi:MAG: DUF3822 family protein [Ferruginibacter sp.]
MNLSFNIQPANVNTTSADLYLEINSLGLSYIIVDNGVCVALVVYHFSVDSSDETVAGYIHQVIAAQPVLQEKFNSVNIVYGYAPFILVPGQFMNDTDGKAMLELVYGDVSERVCRTDIISRHGIHNVYGIPAVIDMVITRYFESATYHHLFSLLPDVVQNTGNHLYCIFSTGQLKVLLMKKGKLQGMQNFTYKVPEDVTFQLLNFCKSFEVDTKDLLVRLSGMIDANSPLYSELYKFFLQLQFEELPAQYQYPETIYEYPSHYFSHLFAIAACV